jgi:hypothetical protein
VVVVVELSAAEPTTVVLVAAEDGRVQPVYWNWRDGNWKLALVTPSNTARSPSQRQLVDVAAVVVSVVGWSERRERPAGNWSMKETDGKRNGGGECF